MPHDAGQRPLEESGEYRQDEQADHIVDTGNQATEPDEETVLAELYGACDEDGVYRGVGPDDGE